VKASDELVLLREFHRQKLAQLLRHVAAARHISDYNFNNTYQYVIAREEMHETWLRDAILSIGGQPDEVPEPEVTLHDKGTAGQHAILAADRDQAQALVDAWRPRIAGMANARNRTLLNVIIGDPRAQALLRAGARRPHRPARTPRQGRRHRRRRASHQVG
jgi:hypothetical protein